jgi:hypothetical protein
MKTWHLEILFVAFILFVANMFGSHLHPVELLGAVAVLLSFGHAQIADRLAEKEGQRAIPEVNCYKKLWYYFIGKELFWLTYFILNHSYSALAGVLIFLSYPIWRRFYRTNIKVL